jgi:hypothetical protein
MTEDVLELENWNGRSYWKLGVPERLVLRYLPEAAEGARSKFNGSVTSTDGRLEAGREMGMGGSKPSGTTKLSCAMTDPSSTVWRSSRSRCLVRLLERPDASEPERSLWDRKPPCGDGPRLRLDSRDSSWLLSRLRVGIRDLNERSPTWGELELECWPKLKEGRSSRHESSEARAGEDELL